MIIRIIIRVILLLQGGSWPRSFWVSFSASASECPTARDSTMLLRALDLKLLYTLYVPLRVPRIRLKGLRVHCRDSMLKLGMCFVGPNGGQYCFHGELTTGFLASSSTCSKQASCLRSEEHFVPLLE